MIKTFAGLAAGLALALAAAPSSAAVTTVYIGELGGSETITLGQGKYDIDWQFSSPLSFSVSNLYSGLHDFYSGNQYVYTNDHIWGDLLFSTTSASGHARVESVPDYFRIYLEPGVYYDMYQFWMNEVWLTLDNNLWTDANARVTYSITVTRLGDAAVPEPATWALMILGFGMAGAMIRRKGRALAMVRS